MCVFFISLFFWKIEKQTKDYHRRRRRRLKNFMLAWPSGTWYMEQPKTSNETHCTEGYWMNFCSETFFWNWKYLSNKKGRQQPFPITGKSLSEALIFASTNPQYDKRLFIELQVQCMIIPSWGEHVVYRNCFWHSEQFLYTTCSPQVWAWNFYILNL